MLGINFKINFKIKFKINLKSILNLIKKLLIINITSKNFSTQINTIYEFLSNLDEDYYVQVNLMECMKNCY